MRRITDFSRLFALIRNNNLVSILNYKKKDGSSRDVHCTLNFETIPKEKLPTPKEEETRQNMVRRGIIVVFDIDKNDWRSLIVGKIKKCIIGDEIYNVTISSQGLLR